MVEVVTGLFALAAGVFAVIAAIGVLRFPDILTRMHAASKVGSFAGALALIAAALGFGSGAVALKALLAILLLFLTAPIAAHLIGRAAARRSHSLPRDRG